MPSVRKKKRRPSVSRKAKVVAVVCSALAAILVFTGLYLKQQETIEANAAEAANYQPVSPGAIAPTMAPGGTSTATAATAATVAFVGDSYSQGARASSPARRWTSVLSAAEQWDEVNVALGGTGYLTTSDAGCGREFCGNYLDVLPEAVAAEPETLVIAGGRNDLQFAGTAELSTQIDSFFDAVDVALPDTEVIVVSPLWDATEVPAQLDLVAEAVQSSATSHGYRYLDVGQPFAAKPELISDDGVHPNDEGYKVLAESVAAAILR